MPENLKISRAGGDAAWLWLCSIAYASRNRTDGIIPAAHLPQLSDRRQPAKLASVLIEQRLWHQPGHDCPRCPQPLRGNYVIHDYLKWQRSAARIDEVSEKRAKSGSKGGSQKAANAQQLAEQSPSNLLDGCQDDAKQTASNGDGKNLAPYTEGSLREPQTDPPLGPPRGGADGEPPAPKRRSGRQNYDYDQDEAFSRFWAVYPNPKGKPEAFAAWLRATAERGADPEFIIRAAVRFARDPFRNPEKTKFPQGWLNGERYNDYPDDMPDRPNSPYGN